MNAIYRRLSRHLLPLLLLPLALASTASAGTFHTLDTTQDGRIDLDELLRAIQFYNSLEYHCAAGTEDGFVAGPGERDCLEQTLDYAPRDWHISVDELLRGIQFYNSSGYRPNAHSEDGFEIGEPPIVLAENSLRYLDFLDTDDDNQLAAAEASQELGGETEFSAFDADGNGYISAFEFLRRNRNVREIADTAGPTIQLVGPPELVLNCGEEFGDPGATAFDADEGDITGYIVVGNAITPSTGIGNYTVTYSISDRACRTASVSRFIQVRDASPPTIVMRGNNPLSVSCGYKYQDPGATATDNCGVKPTLTTDTSTVDTNVMGQYIVTYTATDQVGRVSTAERTVNVVDMTKPRLTLSGEDSMVVASLTEWLDPGATATDTCDDTVDVVVSGEVDTTTPGNYVITYTATDDSGNMATKDRYVRVFDSTRPIHVLQEEFNSSLVYLKMSPPPIWSDYSAHYFYEDTEVQIVLNCQLGHDYYYTSYEVTGLSASLDETALGDFECADEITVSMDTDHRLIVDAEIDSCYCCYSRCCGCEGEGTSEGSIEGEGEGESEGEGVDSSPGENPFLSAEDFPRSDLSMDLDSTSYLAMRKELMHATKLPRDLEPEIEEYLQFFDFVYPRPVDSQPLRLYSELNDCPWTPANRVLRVGLQIPEFSGDTRPPANLVILPNIANDMDSPRRLPLLKEALVALVENYLGPQDHLSMVTYGYTSRLHWLLDSTACTVENRQQILEAIQALQVDAGQTGGTLALAYYLAQLNFQANGINRLLVAAHSDFNLGTYDGALRQQQIAQGLAGGVSLTVIQLDTSTSNLAIPNIASVGGGNIHYTDTLGDIVKALVSETRSTRGTISSDVQLEVEFDPSKVLAYRLLGYESHGGADNTPPSAAAGIAELRRGDRFTALYEVVPTSTAPEPDVMAIVRARHTPSYCPRPSLTTSVVSTITEAAPPTDARFAAAVAEFAMLLRNSKYKGSATYQSTLQLAIEALGEDPYGHRAEFVELVQRASILAK